MAPLVMESTCQLLHFGLCQVALVNGCLVEMIPKQLICLHGLFCTLMTLGCHPFSLNWTPERPKAEAPTGPEETRLLSAWTEPHSVRELKTQWALRRPGSRQQPQAARRSGGAGIPLGVRGGSGRRALAPCQPMGTAAQASLTGAGTARWRLRPSGQFC